MILKFFKWFFINQVLIQIPSDMWVSIVYVTIPLIKYLDGFYIFAVNIIYIVYYILI
jgi:hypothetical protein